MLHHLASTGCEREVWWLHTTHDASTHVFASEVAGLLAQLPSTRSTVYYTSPIQPVAPHRNIRWGRMTEGLAALGLPSNGHAYVCGPPSFMDDVTSVLADLGLDRALVRTERFGSQAPINPGVVKAEEPRPHPPPGRPGSGPQVTFARSGLSAGWADAYESVLELAEACDVPTRWSCRSGVCHTCVTAVLSGEASYDVPPLEPAGDGQVLICLAQPVTELVLDL